MKKMKLTLLALVALIGMATFVPSYVSAAPTDQIRQGVTDVGGDPSKITPLSGRLQQVVNLLLYALGSIAVIMIVIGGIRYTTSNGDSSSIKGAKETIMYAVVGLVVAILAYAIVNFVVGAF